MAIILNNGMPYSVAEFSPDRRYRYTLWRQWDSSKPHCQFIGLNPSTADEVTDDPTVRRCIGYAKAWGYGALCMTNIFAFRATDPKVMKAQANPEGDANDYWLREIAMFAGIIVCAWGGHGAHRKRHVEVRRVLRQHDLHLLARTKTGAPAHPLYLRKLLLPQVYMRKET